MVVSSSYDIVLQHNWETNNHLADPQVDMINLRNESLQKRPQSNWCNHNI